MAQDLNIEQLTAGQEWKTNYNWDFFLSHAGPDKDTAETLYHTLAPPAKVFLDAESLVPGDNFDTALPDALHASLISVILISPNTEKAYYEQEEIAMVIERTRADPDTHRVVPVYINSKDIPPGKIPFGLKRKHSLYISGPDDFAKTGNQLLKTLDMMKKYEIKKDATVVEQQKAVAKITNSSSRTEVISGFNDVTRFVRTPLYALMALFVLMIALLFVCMVIPSDVKGLLIAIVGSLAALLLAGIFWLIARSLRYAPQIAKGNINAG